MSQGNGKHAGGRPRKIKEVGELQAKIKAYFDLIESKPPLEREPVTITGLVLSCGYCDLQSFYDMEKRKEFSSTIKAARLRVAMAYEKRLQGANAAGAIFALKNFGWRDDYYGQAQPASTTPAKFIFVLSNGERKEVKEADLVNDPRLVSKLLAPTNRNG